MARNKGTFNFAANFQVKMQEALDPRIVVGAKSELINKETWPYDGDTLYLYKNMIVGTDEGVYRLLDVAKALDADYSGWERIDAVATQQIAVVDNLTSEDTDKALSARQGKVLMGEIDTIKGKLSGIYSYKGSKDEFDELPTDAEAGDVWNVVAANGNNPAGTNYAWNGTEWDALGGSIDLSNYFNKEEVNAAVKVETDRAVAKENELLELVNAVSSVANDAKSAAAANATTLESVTKSIGEINTDLTAAEGRLDVIEEKNESQDTRLTNLEKLVSGGETGEDGTTLMEMVNANATAIQELQQADVAFNERVLSNETSITTLNGDANTEGSVAKAIKDALAWEDVV